ncbi:alpha/beta fold hydrolase [Nonomuraea sp. NPDC005692]|uniref:thioesterase II family protein n=1 Tax=Nonomuraea sp. NPDC005692 TaxID=3157168 RepID=UPI003407C4EF
MTESPISPNGRGPAGQWLRRLGGRGAISTRLLCLPHAGAGASAFRNWLPHLPSGCELWGVAYPGREDRLGEPPAEDVLTMAQHIAFALQWVTDQPYRLFGHSMGAILAYETCHALRRLGHAAPQHLFVSSSPPPARIAAVTTAERSDTRVRWLPGGPEEGEREQLADLATETLDADLAMLCSYRDPTMARLTAPVTAMHGAADPDMDSRWAPEWKRHTAGDFEVAILPGDHFYCFTAPHDALGIVLRGLR